MNIFYIKNNYLTTFRQKNDLCIPKLTFFIYIAKYFHQYCLHLLYELLLHF